jgi:hypothetical protein
MKQCLLIFVFIISMIEMANGQPIRYVTPNGTGAKNGMSWGNAYDKTQLQTAINEATASQVWVAAGTYKPTSDGNPNISFQMKKDVAIYGGFSGWEFDLSQRNWKSNVTILSGDLNGNDVVTGSGATLAITGNTENSYQVFTQFIFCIDKLEKTNI